MENELEMRSNSINLYLTLFVKSNKKRLFVLGCLMLIVVSSFLYLIIDDSKEIILSNVLLILLILLIFLYLQVKYFLWNLHGIEHLIINTQSISYSHDFGCYKMNPETVEFNSLAVSLDEMGLVGENSFGQMDFFNFDKKTKLAEPIHSTTFFLTMAQILEIQVGISSLFENSSYEEQGIFRFR